LKAPRPFVPYGLLVPGRQERLGIIATMFGAVLVEVEHTALLINRRGFELSARLAANRLKMGSI
jgi:hypothetical protein